MRRKVNESRSLKRAKTCPKPFVDSRNGSAELGEMPAGTVPSLGTVAGVGGEDMASLWASYAMGFKKTPPPASSATPSRSDRDRESSPPGGEGTGSAHDETSSSGNKEDEDDDDMDADEGLDPRHHDPERLKAFNVSKTRARACDLVSARSALVSPLPPLRSPSIILGESRVECDRGSR